MSTSLQESVLAVVQAAGASLPPGIILDFAGSAAPTGWLLLFGQEVSRTTYADLFALLGTTYGVGDGSTTFNLPDLRGRVAAGKDDMGGAAANRLTNANSGVTGTTLGAAGGLETQMAHTHVMTHGHADTIATSAGTSHTHSGTFGSSSHTHNHNHRWMNSGAQTYNSSGTAISLSLAQAASGSGSNQFVRGDAAYNAYTENDATGPSATASVGAEAAHTHPITGGVTNFTGSTASSGTGATQGNVQPTLVLNKIIKI